MWTFWTTTHEDPFTTAPVLCGKTRGCWEGIASRSFKSLKRAPAHQCCSSNLWKDNASGFIDGGNVAVKPNNSACSFDASALRQILHRASSRPLQTTSVKRCIEWMRPRANHAVVDYLLFWRKWALISMFISFGLSLCKKCQILAKKISWVSPCLAADVCCDCAAGVLVP